MAELATRAVSSRVRLASAAAPITVGVLLEGDEASVAGRADRMVGLLGERATAGQPPAQRNGPRPLGHPVLAADGHSARRSLQFAFWAGQLARGARVDPEGGACARVWIRPSADRRRLACWKWTCR